ncbi:hypothetical protein BaRGS_00018435, partial [Batillaria attramentaria]
MTIRSCHKILILFAWTQCLPKRARAEYVPESAAADGFKPVIVSEADTSFILHTQSSMIPDHSGEESFHVSTESDADDVKISFSSRASTSVAPDPQDVLVVTVTNDVPGDHVPFMYGVDFMVVTSIGILASAAVIITVSIVCVRKGRRRCKHRADEADQPVQRIDLMRPDQNERDGENDGRRFSQ